MTEKKKKGDMSGKYQLIPVDKIEEPLVAVRKEMFFNETQILAD